MLTLIEQIENILVELGLERKKARNSIFFPKQADIATRAGFIIDPETIKQKIEKLDDVKKVWIEKGFVNIELSDEFYKKRLKGLQHIHPFKKKQGTTYVEFPSVNPNKPWHIGHLRNALLGNAISNILEFYGENVIRLNYIDDLGLQVAQSLYDYLQNKDNIEPIKFDHWLGKRYVEIASKLKDPKIEKEVREILKKMEQGELRKEARELAEKCLRAQYQTSFKFNIFQDVCVFESDVIKLLKKALEQMEQKGIIKYEKEGELKGCEVAEVSGNKKVIVRSDGTATYLGKDLAFHMWKFGMIKGIRFKEFFEQENKKMLLQSADKGIELQRADKAINIIGTEQSGHQQMIKKILNKNLIHVAYSHVRLPEGKFSGRKGTWKGYTADEMYEEAVRRAKKINQKVAEEVGLSAIIFSILRISPEKEIIFRWEDALSMENSGPYLLYSLVRAKKVVEKSSKKEQGRIIELDEKERQLIKALSKFYAVIEDSANHNAPHILIDYLLKLAIQFNSFYSSERVIGHEKEAQRIELFKAFANIMEKGIILLGMKPVEEM